MFLDLIKNCLTFFFLLIWVECIICQIHITVLSLFPLLFQEIVPELLTAEGISLPVQFCHLERHKVDVGVHCPCDLPYIVPLIDILQNLIVRERDLRREDVGLVFQRRFPISKMLNS